jgi:hypothetical protein
MFYLWPYGSFIPSEIMKASVCLEYDDDSEVWFDFKSYDLDVDAIATLMMVCRGTLMASMACRVTAYNEDGFDICSYVK